MTLVILYIATFVVFLGIDYFGLGAVVKPVFEKHIKHMMLENFRVLPALAFYAFFVAVMLWFVSWPALVNGHSLLWVLGHAALLGALAYGTYEFSNLAVLKSWTWEMVWVDVIWGIALSAISTTAGVWITRMLMA